MLKWIIKFKVFIITFIIGGILFFPAFYIIVSDIFGKHYDFITPAGQTIWLILCAPFGFILNHVFDTNGSIFTGIFIDILLYSLLFQFLWNKYKKRKERKLNS